MSALKSLFLAGLLLAALGYGRHAFADPPSIDNVYHRLLDDKSVKAALADLKASEPKTWADQKSLAEIPAPPFHETTRAASFQEHLRALGIADATADAEGNIIGIRKGSGNGPMLVLSAHLDTVFPEGTDVRVKEQNGRFYGPGLTDDSRGLAAILAVLRALETHHIHTNGDIMFVGTVGEEGLGNLRGVRALFRDHREIDGFITVEPALEGPPRVANGATGSRRWEVMFQGPGGHSFQNFGTASAIHALGRAVALISDLRPPPEPRTTFTVGVISGGTSVNAIAANARMEVDIRSNDARTLADFESKVFAAIDAGVAAENAHWNTNAISSGHKLLGERPGGITPASSPLVQAALRAAMAVGLSNADLVLRSTDANGALEAGVPAITLSGGGVAANLHSLNEWYEPTKAWLGPQAVLLTVLGLVGTDSGPPLLQKRTP